MNTSRDHRDTFEHWLQESVDSLKMYPAVKVWFSLYNHMHPSRKFPSAPVALFMICWMLLLQPMRSVIITKQNQAEYNENPALVSPMSAQKNSSSINIAVVSKEIRMKKSKVSSNIQIAAPIQMPDDIELKDFKKDYDFKSSKLLKGPSFEKSEWIEPSGTLRDRDNLLFNSILITSQSQLQNIKKPQEWNENAIKTSDAEGKFSYQLYAGGMLAVSYPIHHSDNEVVELAEDNQQTNVSTGKMTNIQTGRNWEAGGGIVYRLSSLMQLKAGFQLNYSSKGLHSGKVNMSKSIMQIPNEELEMMSSRSISTLANRRYQFSLPIGADLKLAGDNFIQWYAGATVQPSFNMQYSDDWKESMDDVDAEKTTLKNWNLNGGVETFLSLKLTKKVMFNAGPQFRYQLFSSLRERDLPNERIYNVGLKFGISSSF